ncbi:MAG: NfeD family protein [Chloroflexota bacterium]
MSRRSVVWLAFLLIGLLALLSSSVAADGGNVVRVVKIKGAINPVVADYVSRSIGVAEQERAHAIVIEIDTPGGLDSSMQQIVQSIVQSKVPVIAYVSPQGGRAASAGAFIVLASHVAAMAPNTNIGAAHPVAMGEGEMDETMTAKVTNDAVARIKSLAERRGRNVAWAEKAVRESISSTEKEALDQRVIEYIAPDLDSLLRQIDGREIALDSGKITLRTSGAITVPIEMNFIEQFLHVISDPNIAYILMILGINGILFELMNPGAILPGMVGGICLVMAFFALGTLPVNYAGVALIILAFILFVADVKMPTHGILTAGGVVSMVLGSLLLLNSDAPYFSISWSVIAGVVIATASFFFLAISAVARTYRKPASTGREGLLHALGIARTELNPDGVVLLQGENWDATVEGEPVAKGAKVIVTGVDGLHLTVKPYIGEMLTEEISRRKERKGWRLLRS